MKPPRPAFEVATIDFKCNAPAYRTHHGSGLEDKCVFEISTEHRPSTASTPVHLTSLAWWNGSSAPPILTLKGSASPKMLCDFAKSLLTLADRMDDDNQTINGIK